jgi:hypothetical protein
MNLISPFNFPIQFKILGTPLILFYFFKFGPHSHNWIFFFVFDPFIYVACGCTTSWGRWSHHQVVWFRVARKPECIGFIIDSRVRDWLWLRKVLTPLLHTT